ncbi:hypothetical protein KHA90_15640 [Flavobacterium psychroterrae]|uniref:DUF4595 domain-containing protein n=1 Tax=Flavobacterium psychroterrae TaxID=2133767 RepID=A0ABS5PDT2_9FLAO|nr:hypothetical protein [Flavobacterium psychroterrae]MBS7232452.1 hypothetical protein [Flavobacterium psychroterrae]
MKKLLLLFSALTLLLISCSSDEKSSSEDKSILPGTISYTYPSVYLGTNSKSTLSYDGNKLLTSIDESSKTVFTYTGKVITKQEKFAVDSKGLETKNIEVNYTYENGKLKTRVTRRSFTVKYPEGEYIGKTVYTHTSDNLISYVEYSVNPDTKMETKVSEGSLTYKNGNLVQFKSIRGSSVSTIVQEYDTKNNPLKNILGFDLLLTEVEFSANNILKINRTDSEFPNPAVYLVNYIYNDKDYPTKRTSFTSDGKSIEYEIGYTY